MSVTPGWSEAVNGFTVAYGNLNPEDPASVGVITVTGTAGDDAMRVYPDPSGPNRLAFELNGAPYALDLAQLSAGLHQVVLGGGAGNDRVVSGVAYDTVTVAGWWGVRLDGGDGDDFLVGGSACHVMNGGNGDDLLVGGNGRNYINGDDGNDTLYGHGLSYDGHDTDPTYDILDGGNGYDVVHGGSMGWVYSGQWIDLVFNGYAPVPGDGVRVQALPDSGSDTPWFVRGDPLLRDAGGSQLAVVDHVLVITGTTGDDVVSIEMSDAGSVTLTASINGVTNSYSILDVSSYVFDSRGGHDRVDLTCGNGSFPLVGWAVRSADPNNVVDVQRHETEYVFDDQPAETRAEAARARRLLAEERRAERKAVAAARRAERQARRAEARLRRQMRRDARRELSADVSGPAAVPVAVAGLFSSVLVAAHAPGDILTLLG
jgi:hypothetical protein